MIPGGVANSLLAQKIRDLQSIGGLMPPGGKLVDPDIIGLDGRSVRAGRSRFLSAYLSLYVLLEAYQDIVGYLRHDDEAAATPFWVSVL